MADVEKIALLINRLKAWRALLAANHYTEKVALLDEALAAIREREVFEDLLDQLAALKDSALHQELQRVMKMHNETLALLAEAWEEVKRLRDRLKQLTPPTSAIELARAAAAGRTKKEPPLER